MKTKKILLSILVLVLLFGINGCKKKNQEQQSSSKGYVGSIYLKYSRDFPQFSAMDRLDVTVSPAGILTCGPSDSKPIVTEDTLYNGSDPVTRVKYNGSMTFNEAKGNIFTNNGKEYMSVWVYSTLQYQVTIWGWDKKDQQWVQSYDGPFSYSDTYSNGPLQFSVTDAELSGSSIVATIPDEVGNFTYGYILTLVPSL